MKKFFALLAITGMLFTMASNISFAQETDAEDPASEQVDSSMADAVEDSSAITAEEPVAIAEEATEEAEIEMSLHKQVKRLFIEGGATFMGFVLLTLIFGLALAIERIIYLNLSATNTDKLLSKIEEALGSGGVDAAKEVCRNTRGPIASIFYQGLDRAHEGIDVAEKSVIAYGSVQMGLLEKNLSWIQLFISIAPMLGFMGTVIGMIAAFDSIQLAGDVSPQLVASGIKVALITTVSGLVVAIILQIFYNYIVSRIDSIVNKMEDASISLIDLLVHHNLKK
ncbi:MotA/TolQ/ExbB proton channel family protein [Bacteroidota bacterium]